MHVEGANSKVHYSPLSSSFGNTLQYYDIAILHVTTK